VARLLAAFLQQRWGKSWRVGANQFLGPRLLPFLLFPLSKDHDVGLGQYGQKSPSLPPLLLFPPGVERHNRPNVDGWCIPRCGQTGEEFVPCLRERRIFLFPLPFPPPFLSPGLQLTGTKPKHTLSRRRRRGPARDRRPRLFFPPPLLRVFLFFLSSLRSCDVLGLGGRLRCRTRS